jgi:hypothetical protein
MTEKSRPSRRKESLPTTSGGAIRPKMHAHLSSSAALFGRMKEDDRKVLFFMAQKMARQKAIK